MGADEGLLLVSGQRTLGAEDAGRAELKRLGTGGSLAVSGRRKIRVWG